eukprot:797654-Rhodomonas_salina.1
MMVYWYPFYVTPTTIICYPASLLFTAPEEFTTRTFDTPSQFLVISGYPECRDSGKVKIATGAKNLKFTSSQVRVRKFKLIPLFKFELKTNWARARAIHCRSHRASGPGTQSDTVT